MTTNPEQFEYSEDDAVKYVLNYLPQEIKDRFSEDEINYIIDVMYDFYDEKGFMGDDSSEDDMVEFDEDELIEYVFKNACKDKVAEFTREDVTFIVQGELKYCESLGMFD